MCKKKEKARPTMVAESIRKIEVDSLIKSKVDNLSELLPTPNHHFNYCLNSIGNVYFWSICSLGHAVRTRVVIEL